MERLEPKQELLARVEKVAAPDAVVSSNTSGLPLATVAEGRSEDFRRRFLGTHFFNPPRLPQAGRAHPNPDTDPEVLERMRAFVERVLGKGAVVAKDTPNFIANRLGSFAGMHDVRYALEHGYSIEEVDALTGPLVGRPKTATFRLFDQVGLDVMVGVAGNLHELAPTDESRDVLGAPEPLRRMLEAAGSATRPAAASIAAAGATARPCSTSSTWTPSSTGRRPGRTCRSSMPPATTTTWGTACGSCSARPRRTAQPLPARHPAAVAGLRRPPGAGDRRLPGRGRPRRRVGLRLPAGPVPDLGRHRRGRRGRPHGGPRIEVPAWVTEMLAAGHQAFYRDGQVYSP